MRPLYNDAVAEPSRGPDPSLALEFCGLPFASPIVLLSGCVGFGEEYTRVEGFSNREMAARLGLSPNTIAVHRANLMNTLGVHKTAELVAYALQHGLVNPLP